MLARKKKQIEMPFALSSLGDLLVNTGAMDHEELAFALTEQTRTREKLGQIVVRLGFASDAAVRHALDMQASLRGAEPENACLVLLHEQMASLRDTQKKTAALLSTTRNLTAT